MAKQCDDCGRRNFDSAVTCVECGSLFPEMVGRLVEDEPEGLFGLGEGFEEDVSPGDGNLAPAQSAATATARAPSTLEFTRCGDCKLVMEAGPSRCKRCGSRRLEALASTGPAALRAWAARQHIRRGRDRSPDTEFPTVGLGEVLGLATAAVVKLFVEIPLGVAILLSAMGPGGVTATTYAWRYPLGIVLLASATSGAVGAYGLFYLERFGPILLSISFALDALLVFWLVVHMLFGLYDFWPGTGPYFLLFLVCSILSVAVGRLATGHRLGSA
jgi:hypothetical protein